MRDPLVRSLTLCVALCAAAPAYAATAAKAAPGVVKHARHAKHAPAKAAAKDTSATRDAKANGPRTLQDIHIEGEIPTPQVLFITARDQRRFVDFQTQRYRKTSREVGEQTVFPSRIVVTDDRPADQPKEQKP